MSYQTVKECFYTLKIPRVVSASVNSSDLSYSFGDIYTSISESIDLYNSFIYATDAALSEGIIRKKSSKAEYGTPYSVNR